MIVTLNHEQFPVTNVLKNDLVLHICHRSVSNNIEKGFNLKIFIINVPVTVL